jgi:hypothetical protein
MNLRVLSIGAAVAVFAAGSVVSFAVAGSNNPNPHANARCPFGPGKARWDVKTSIPPDQDPQQLANIALDDLINAPNLQVDPRTVAAAGAHVARVRALMRSPAQAPAALGPVQPFVAHMRWGPRRPHGQPAGAAQPQANGAMPAGRDFLLNLPPITPAIVQRADAIRQNANPDEAPPSPFHAVLSAQMQAIRFPTAVALGNNDFHEGDLVTVSGVVIVSTCEHDDGDFHIDLGSADGSSTCAIVEVPNPAYIAPGPLRTLIASAEAVAKTLAPGDQVTVSGQLFYDATHTSSADPGGGRGKHRCAQSLWEVHPVLSIVKG